METVPRGIPRYPSTKTGVVYTAAVDESTGITQVLQVPAGRQVLVLEGMDVNVIGTGAQTPSPTFQVLVSFDATANPQYILFSGQVNPNSGFYFGWRGAIELGNSSVLFFNPVAENWHIVVWGYITPL